LDDYRKAAAVLTAATAARQLKLVNVTANHEALPSGLRPGELRAHRPDPLQAPLPPQRGRCAVVHARPSLRSPGARPRID
jgi:hypothetical protein